MYHSLLFNDILSKNTLSHTSGRSFLFLRNAFYCSTTFCHTTPYHTLLAEAFLFSVMHTTVQRHSVTHNTLSHTSGRSLLILRNAHYCSTTFCRTTPYHTLLAEAFLFSVMHTTVQRHSVTHNTLSHTSGRSLLILRNAQYCSTTFYHTTPYHTLLLILCNAHYCSATFCHTQHPITHF